MSEKRSFASTKWKAALDRLEALTAHRQVPKFPIGYTVKPWGKVSAWLFNGGEHYYMFVGKRGAVSLMPVNSVHAHSNPT